MNRLTEMLTGISMLISCGVHAQAVPSNQPEAPTSPTTQSTAETRNGGAILTEVIVTAQKREQTLSSVPISVTAASGEELAQRGIVDTADLGKMVSGFVFTPGTQGQPVYVLRGIGLYDAGLASSPTVSVYVDQVPLPFSIMTPGAILDLERVEVLKGPQGTLFGANNTGGSINYIAAKPTPEFEAGASFTYERFDKSTVRGFVSGPLRDTLQTRVAVQGTSGGAWQKSLTRDDSLGDSRQLLGRWLLDWQPSDKLRATLNLNGYRDRSDTVATQIVRKTPSIPGFETPSYLSAPLARDNARSADWNPDESIRKDDTFYQAALRVDYDLTPELALTSISAYSDLDTDWYTDTDGMAAQTNEANVGGYIRDFNQELRLQGNADRLVWLVGGNFQDNKVLDLVRFRIREGTVRQLGVPNIQPFTVADSILRHSGDSYAVFGNVEYKLTQNLSVQGGVRYTRSERTGHFCSADRTPGLPLHAFFASIGSPVGADGCHNLDTDTGTRGEYRIPLDEDNTAFRASIDYKLSNSGLLYASFSRGYKSGVITNVGASIDRQVLPAEQEELDAYEIGLKTPFLDRTAYLNLSTFYYDYRDKQVRARIFDPVFNLLERLLNIPKSRVWGIDGDLTFNPIAGLTLKAGGTYLNSKVNGDFETFNGAPVYNQVGQQGNFRGSELIYTPKFTANADAEYEWDIGEFTAALGTTLIYHGSDRTAFTVQGFEVPDIYDLPSYVLVDVRARVSSHDDRWSVEVFGRNIFDKYYITGVFQGSDEIHHYAGMPATYGVTLSTRF